MVSPHLGVSKNTEHPTIRLEAIWQIRKTIPFQNWVLQKNPWKKTPFFIFFPSFFRCMFGVPWYPYSFRPSQWMSISEVRRRALRQDLIDPVDENCCGTCNMLQSFKDGQHRSIGLENPPFLDLCFGCFRKKTSIFMQFQQGLLLRN